MNSLEHRFLLIKIWYRYKLLVTLHLLIERQVYNIRPLCAYLPAACHGPNFFVNIHDTVVQFIVTLLLIEQVH